MIGVAVICNIFPKITHAILILHLLGTFSVLVTAPRLMFDPYFPMLTLAGEFVIKNLVLATGGIVVILYHMHHPKLSKGVL